MSQATTFTPGPWMVKAAEFKDDGTVAYEIQMPRAEINVFNARLIAQAPAMYAALVELLEWYDGDEMLPRDAFESARKALDAVEGK